MGGRWSVTRTVSEVRYVQLSTRTNLLEGDTRRNKARRVARSRFEHNDPSSDRRGTRAREDGLPNDSSRFQRTRDHPQKCGSRGALPGSIQENGNRPDGCALAPRIVLAYLQIFESSISRCPRRSPSLPFNFGHTLGGPLNATRQRDGPRSKFPLSVMTAASEQRSFGCCCMSREPRNYFAGKTDRSGCNSCPRTSSIAVIGVARSGSTESDSATTESP